MGAAAVGNGHVSPNLLSNPRNPDSPAGELSQRGYLATRYWPLATGHWLLAAVYWLLATGYSNKAIH
jgi:hypothetical protein